MPKEKKPNIVFAFADDWGRYASIYSKYENVAPLTSSVNEFIHTPNFGKEFFSSMHWFRHLPVPPVGARFYQEGIFGRPD